MRNFLSFINFENLFRNSQRLTGRETVMRGVHSRRTPGARWLRRGNKFAGKQHAGTRAIERRRRQIASGVLKPNVDEVRRRGSL